MNTLSSKINLFLNKLSEFGELNETDSQELKNNFNQSLLIYLLADGKDIVSAEISEKLKNSPDQTVVQAYLKEMSENEEGKKIIQNRLAELVNELLESVKDKLTPSQKEELLKILE